MEDYEVLNEFDKMLSEHQSRYMETLSISITNECPLQCKHCIVDANSRKHGFVPEVIPSFMNRLKTYKNLANLKSISVTGGEPFCKKQILKSFSDFCHETNLRLNVITSAYWARDINATELELNRYPNIDHVTLSTDDYHLEHVPFSNIANAIKCCKNMQIGVSLKITGHTQETLSHHPQLSALLDLVDVRTDIIYQNTIPLGRAARIAGINRKITRTIPCMVCVANAPLIREDGDVLPCCSYFVTQGGQNPLTMGNFFKDETAHVFEQIKTNWILHFIRIWGFRELIEEYKESNNDSIMKGDYWESDVCHVCIKAFADQDFGNFVNILSQSLQFRLRVAIALKEYLKDSYAFEWIKSKYTI